MNAREIKILFPEISKIKSGILRRGIIDAWLLAARRGGWKRIDKIPFTLLTSTKRTLVDHTRSVTRMAMAIAMVRRDCTMDHIIAGGLVHDVGKLLEYEQRGRKFKVSALGKLVRHPVSGYALVLEAGLPMKIAHIVAAHSHEGDKVTRSQEAIIIHHCDFIDFDIEKHH
ncbi:HD domain-containing protein [candidate division WOR-3 bacterium]|nr:HD domain-containing protein [candidate division WOR-3 bacterium]